MKKIKLYDRKEGVAIPTPANLIFEGQIADDITDNQLRHKIKLCVIVRDEDKPAKAVKNDPAKPG